MEAARDQQSMRPEIVENYKELWGTRKFQEATRRPSGSCACQYLVGLNAIVLANQSALTRDQRRQKIWSRNRKVRLKEVRGCYYRTTKSSPATVWLYVDNILRSEVPWFRRMPFLRYDALATVLYHEIGHHIHAVHKPVFECKEDIAEHWSKKLFGRSFRQRYWYLRPVVYPEATRNSIKA
jgi:hypothetical protein